MIGFDIRQIFLSLLGFILFHAGLSRTPIQEVVHASKSVAIVGAGSAGLAMLHALVDLQDELPYDLDIVLYERRQDIGGIWLPDTQPVRPPILPETPIYPLLRTNVPVPVMTYRGLPYHPGTPLFPSHEYVKKYLQDFALRYNLLPYIMLNHTVVSASWVGTPEEGSWDVLVASHDGNEIRRSFDHLVVANGHFHYPHTPLFPGQEEWLSHGNNATGRRREILHSIFYRDPELYANQTVVVVGGGYSGEDVISQVVLSARKVYFSIRGSANSPPADSAEVKPEIAYFTPDAIVFSDGSRVYDVDSVILCTGYDLRVPFLETSGEIIVKPNSNERGHGLSTNLRYLFPLHRHIFSLSSSYPTNALAFIGLPILTFTCPMGLAQSTYAARAIVNASCIGSREELLKELDATEDDLRSRGYDPYYVGHRMVNGSAFDYQDRLIDTLKSQGMIPDDGMKYVEVWRREVGSYLHLKRGWKRVEGLGLQRQWLKGVETEAEWADMMKRLNEWQKDWETEHGLIFPAEETWF